MINNIIRCVKHRSSSMVKQTALVAAILLSVTQGARALDAPIMGSVQSKCSITTDTPGIYGNPTPSVLSTAATDGGIEPVVRFDVISADYYKAVITHPQDFSSSPTLTDTVVWNGAVSVSEVSDPLMSGYDAAKRIYNNVTEFDLTVAGTTWFSITSDASYGFDKSWPAGNYNAVVSAECIAL